jgi:predicted anti-sigma-YlaC factor YlaD
VTHEEIRCIEMVEVITDWMEGALHDDTRAAVEEHLAICPDCIAYLDQLRTATALAAELDRNAEPPPSDVRARLVAAFRASRPSAPGNA